MATKDVCEQALEQYGAELGQIPGAQGVSWGESANSKRKKDYRIQLYVDSASLTAERVPRYVVVTKGKRRKHVFIDLVDIGEVSKEVERI